MADQKEINPAPGNAPPPVEYASHIAFLAQQIAQVGGADPEKDSALRRALAGLGTGAEKATPEDRLKALELVYRIGRANKAIKKFAESQLKGILGMSPAGLGGSTDAKAQLSACTWIAKHKAEWVPDYLAISAISPAVPPRIRLAAISALFSKCATWEEVFVKLISAVAALGSAILTAQAHAIAQNAIGGARIAISKSSGESGAGFVNAVSGFLVKCEESAASPEQKPAWKPVGNEVVLLVDAASARRPAILFQAGLHEVLLAARKLVPKGKLTTAGEAGWAAIVNRLAELVVLLASRGVAATDLFSAAEKIGGSREAILKITRRMAKSIAPASPALATLLSEGHLPSENSSELSESDDATLATLLLRANELLSIEAVSRSQSGSPLSVAHALAIEVQTLAKRRGLKILGRVGESVQFSPVQHRFAGKIAESPGAVRIAVPAVVRETGEIVTPAIVEAEPRERG